MQSGIFRGLVALALVVTTTFVTMPLSAADLTKSPAVIGSVSAVGAVELRGMGVTREGTLFSGDNIRTRGDGNARLMLSGGDKIEIAQNADVIVSRDAQGVKVAMKSGIMGFSMHPSLRIDVLQYEVTATDEGAGNVVVLGTTAGVRAIKGKVTVRNLKTSETVVLTKDQEKLFPSPDGARSARVAVVASNAAPAPIPAPAAASPAPAAGQPGGFAMDAAGWAALIGGIALGTISIASLVVGLQNRSDIKDLLASPS